MCMKNFIILFIGLCGVSHSTIQTDFLSIDSYKHFSDGKYIFKKNDGSEIGFTRDKIVRAADISFDQIFKSVFSGEEKHGEFTGKQRLMSLLNSIFFPSATGDDFMIREIEELPNESTSIDGANTRSGVLIFDIACQCKCWKETPKTDGTKSEGKHNVKVFDVEMQTSRTDDFINRLYNYGYRLYNKYNQDCIALGFLNHKKNKNDDDLSGGMKPFYIDISTEEALKPSDHLKTLVIDLSKRVSIIKNNGDVIISGKILQKTGKQWLLVLGMRHWIGEIESGRCYIPLCDDIDPVVKSALVMLGAKDEDELQTYIRQQKKEDDIVKTRLKDQYREYLFNLKKNGMTDELAIDILHKMIGKPIEEIKEIINQP